MAEKLTGLKILCVDRDAAVLQSVSNNLTTLGYEILSAQSYPQALKLLHDHAADTILIVAEFQNVISEAIEFRTSCLEQFREIPFVAYSGLVAREVALRTAELKIAAFIEKPIRVDQLKKVVEAESRERSLALSEKKSLENTFITEADQILEDVESQIMSLESQPDDQNLIDSIFRLIHTVKGSSGVLDSNVILRFAHKFEDLLSSFKRKERKITPEDVTVMLKACDILKQLVQAVKTRQIESFDADDLVKLFEQNSRLNDKKNQSKSSGADRESRPASQQNQDPSSKRDGVKISMQTLDDFMELSGEITVIRNMVNKLVKAIEKSSPGNKDVALLIDLLDEMYKINAAMQEKIIDMRKVPLAHTLKPLPRTIRDLSRSLNKEIELAISGDQLRIDATIGQVLSDSFIHLVRNSADHGIEEPQVRMKSGKNRVGKIAIKCFESRENVVIEIEDDGNGIDVEKVKSKILENSLVSREDLLQMSESKILQKIFEPGFSTAASISDVSGRGVGMDMVRSAVERLQGRIDIETKRGRGTKFTMQIPIPKSVTILNSLLITVASQNFAIPHELIYRLFHLEEAQKKSMVFEVEGGLVFDFDNKIVPLVDLGKCLGLGLCVENPANESEMSIVLVDAGGGSIFGLIVDQINDSEEIVVKQLGKHLESIGVYEGATFLGDGSVGLILSVEGIAAKVRNEIDRMSHQSPERVNQASLEDEKEYLLCGLYGSGIFGLPTEQVFRIENISPDQIQYSGDSEVIIYRDKIMYLLDLTEHLRLDRKSLGDSEDSISLIVTLQDGKYFGFKVRSIIDIVRGDFAMNECIVRTPGFSGDIFVGDSVVSILDLRSVLVSKEFVTAPVKDKAVRSLPQSVKPLETTKMVEAPKVSGWGVFD